MAPIRPPIHATLIRDHGQLKRARAAALDYARLRQATQAPRATQSDGPDGEDHRQNSAHAAAHHGKAHVDFWNEHYPGLLRRLPGQFDCLEVGCGLGWHAALTAAHSGARVIGLEYDFGPDGVHSRGNATTFRRLAEWAPALDSVVEFQGWDRMALSPRVQFVRGTAHYIPLPTASVDLLTTYNCLEHIQDLAQFFTEAARVLRVGGFLFASAEPFYHSPFGHHMEGVCPLPWGHLLWSAEEFAAIVAEMAPAGMEWAKGVPVGPEPILKTLKHGLNFVAPADLRAALRPGAWKIEGWTDLISNGTLELEKAIGVRRALRGVPLEALATTGVRFLLRRMEGPTGWRWPMRLPVTMRHRLRGRL